MPAILRCPNCQHERKLLGEEVLTVLQAHGMLRRENEPETALIRELLVSIANQLPCGSCGAVGVEVRDGWSDEWVDVVSCASCAAVIPAERIEVFPDTKLCSKCQAKRESGEDVGQDAEYCSRCGGILKLTKKGGSGLAGYRMTCGDCGATG